MKLCKELCKVIREISVADYEREMDSYLGGGYRASSSGFYPGGKDDTPYFWAILVKEG